MELISACASHMEPDVPKTNDAKTWLEVKGHGFLNRLMKQLISHAGEYQRYIGYIKSGRYEEQSMLIYRIVR